MEGVSNRPEITAMLSLAIKMHIDPHKDPRIYWAKEVTFDYATGNAVRVDYMKFKPVNNTVSGIEKGDFYCYEVKSSVEDFKSKLDKVSEDAYEEVGEVAEGWPEFERWKGYKGVDELQEKLDKVFNEWLEETKQVPGFCHVQPLADLVMIPED